MCPRMKHSPTAQLLEVDPFRTQESQALGWFERAITNGKTMPIPYISQKIGPVANNVGFECSISSKMGVLQGVNPGRCSFGFHK